MIRYALKCGKGHGFDSWFADADAFESLSRARQLACPECGSPDVTKSLMAPGVRTSERPALTAPDSEKAKALSKLRDAVEKNSDYVGLEFAAEARAMHEGAKPHRSIYGEAKPEDAKALIEDGVPVAPLPFTPRSKTN